MPGHSAQDMARFDYDYCPSSIVTTILVILITTVTNYFEVLGAWVFARIWLVNYREALADSLCGMCSSAPHLVRHAVTISMLAGATGLLVAFLAS